MNPRPEPRTEGKTPRVQGMLNSWQDKLDQLAHLKRTHQLTTQMRYELEFDLARLQAKLKDAGSPVERPAD